MKEKLKKIRRIIVVTKFTIARGYVWCQTPTMAIIAAGVLKPYFPNISFTLLVILGALVFLTVGYIDKRFRFLDEELSYNTERNTKLLKEIRGK